MLEPTFDERGAEPFATGDFAHVYKATFDTRPVAIKTLKVTATTDPKKIHRVSGLIPKTSSDCSH